MKAFFLTLLCCLICGLQPIMAVSLPNFLLIMADDCTYTDTEVYGGQAKTPHMNALAAEGMKFQGCLQAAPMCSPTRHCLYTGLYPVKSGAYPNHTRAYDWVKSIAHYLQDAGYETYLSGKTHIGPRSVFPFEYSGKKNPDPAAFEAALEKSESSGAPFLFIAASNEPHSPWDKGDASQYPPVSLKLPPIFVDTPETRDAFSCYLAEVTFFDSQVGELVELLDRSSLKENTLVIVLTEQGNSFPFAKWTCYEAGLRSGCIVRWPAKVEPGSITDAIVEYVDVVPTFLEAAGLERPDILDGRSFLPVLTGSATEHKRVAYGLQTTRGINNGSDYFAIRTVSNDRYRYIRNLTPEMTFENAATANRIFKTWREAAAAGDAHAAALVQAYQHRPAEELYDCLVDRWNRTNLISKSDLFDVRSQLRSQLDAWMEEQGDQGQATELKAFERMPGRSKKARKAQGKK